MLPSWKKKKNSDNHLLVLMTYTCSWSSAAVFRNIRYIHENTFELGKKRTLKNENEIAGKMLPSWKKKKNSDNHLLVLMTYTCSWSSAAVFRNIRYIHENTFELGKKKKKLCNFLSLIRFVFTLITIPQRLSLVLYCLITYALETT